MNAKLFFESAAAWFQNPTVKGLYSHTKRISKARINVREFSRTIPDLYVTASDGAESDRTTSTLCTFAQLDSPEFRKWVGELGERWRGHRKMWELAFICETLFERGLLDHGKRGLGFAVGLERLPSLFAAKGCTIVASDLASDDVRNKPWAKTGQWTQNMEVLNQYGLCAPDVFNERVVFRPVDMNKIPDDLTGFDFTWSTCSFEHTGSIELGLQFLKRQMDCLSPGGIAVHTTEFNLSSNENTITSGQTVVFRLKDIERVCAELRAQGHAVEPINLDPGDSELDRYVDGWPYSPDRHLRLDLDGYASTSIGLIVRKRA